MPERDHRSCLVIAITGRTAAGSRGYRALIAALMLGAAPLHVDADAVEVVNAVRSGDCSGAAVPPLRHDRRLARAAKTMSRGAALRAAVSAADYRAAELSSIHLGGYQGDQALRAVLRANYCRTLMAAEYRDVGTATRGGEIWLVLGAEIKIPSDAAATSRQVLDLVNKARTQPRRCGTRSFAAVSALTLDAQLGVAALSHAKDMARHAYLEHRGRDGSSPAQRVTAAGYRWRQVGENIAAGPATPTDVVNGWLNSPGHCANIMSADFTQMGVAYASSRDDYGIYWAQVFAAPR